MRTPASAPSRGDHRPAAQTTVSQAISPAAVITPATRPRRMAMPVTGMPSTTRAPRWRAPRAMALARSVGLMRPSLGIQMPPASPSGAGQS